jgi:hypothetical protein
MSQHRRSGIGLLLVATLAIPLSGKVAPTTLEKLTQVSDQVVVGYVLNVRKIAGLRVAELQVTETLKGDPNLIRLHFLAQPTWICDITEAGKGETGLYFLSSPDSPEEGWEKRFRHKSLPQPFFGIAWSGRGRMPLREVNGDQYVTVWEGDVRLPPGIQSIDGPEPEYSFIRSVRLDEVRAFVLKVKDQREKAE